MKSIVEVASSIVKAIQQGWERAGKPQEFTVRILEEPETNFLGLTRKPAKIALLFSDKTQHAQKAASSASTLQQGNKQERSERTVQQAQQSVAREARAPKQPHVEQKQRSPDRFEQSQGGRDRVRNNRNRQRPGQRNSHSPQTAQKNHYSGSAPSDQKVLPKKDVTLSQPAHLENNGTHQSPAPAQKPVVTLFRSTHRSSAHQNHAKTSHTPKPASQKEPRNESSTASSTSLAHSTDPDSHSSDSK